MIFLPRIAPCLLFLGSVASAITIELDYTYDTNGFFNQAGSKEAMRAVADFFEERLHDNLLEINQNTFGSGNSWTATFTHPGTGALQEIPSLIVPEDTVIIFMGGRDLGGAAGRGGPGGYAASASTSTWFDRVEARGQSGKLDTPATDFGPWGGSVTFHTGKTWHFELDSRPPISASDFVSVALHEMGHVLGIGTASSWAAQIDGDDLFNGVRSVESFGAAVPVDASNSHWQDDAACQAPLGYDPANDLNVLSLTYTSFGTGHGDNQIALMDPSSCTITSSTTLQVFTDLDLAALSDIGWEVFQPVTLVGPIIEPSEVDFNWPSTTGQTYQLQRRADLLTDWVDLTLAVGGDGQVMSFSDTTAPVDKAFYRLRTVADVEPEVFTSGEAFAARSALPLQLEDRSKDPQEVEGCGEHTH